MAFSLSLPGGWYDLPDSLWAPGNQVVEDHLVALNSLIRFAAVCDEYLPAAPQKNGGTVPLSISADDGYNYTRSEASYAWALQASINPDTGHNSDGGDLFILNQFIEQDTARVASSVAYYVQGGQESVSTDGLLSVLLCCRRGAGQRTAVSSGTGGGASGGGGGAPSGGSTGSDNGPGDQGDGRRNTPRMTF